MNGIIHGLSWFPNADEKFVTWGQDISLYKVIPKNDNEPLRNRDLQLSSKHTATFLASESRYQYVRCLQPSYHKDTILAVGLADGKVGICNFNSGSDQNSEFTPRQQRSCLCLAWNHIEPNVLAIGHDRNRSDCCITIWDTGSGFPKETPQFFGLSESAHSLCWDSNHRALVAGMSQKMIKLFDLRQNSPTCTSINTKAVNGLAVSGNGNYLSSFLDSVILLWDLRSIDKPLKQIQCSKDNILVTWCPNKPNLLSSLQRDSPFIYIYDIHAVDVESARELYHTKNQYTPFQSKLYSSNKNTAISSASWHPIDNERILVLSESGSLTDFRIPPKIVMSWNNQLKISTGLVMRPLNPPISSQVSVDSSQMALISSYRFAEFIDDDISETIRIRAQHNYGLKAELRHFGDFLNSSYLKNVWKALLHIYRGERLIGLKNVLKISLTTQNQGEELVPSTGLESHVLQWPDSIKNTNNLVCYRSEQRDAALKLCGWTSDQDMDRFIRSLCDNKEYSRAAMICTFHLKIQQACEILSKAEDQSDDHSMYRIAAIALYSFNADQDNNAWKTQRINANMQIQDPHLRVIFSFITIENENFEAVLKEEQILLSDRIAFGCKYLSENKLAEYIKSCIQTSIEKGDLNGLLLTGESAEGINIMQSYIDRTEDVQTVSLIAIWFFQSGLFSDSRIQYWTSSYLNLLDSWRLWEKRAELEINMQNIRSVPTTSRTVFLLCNFCGKSVSSALQDDARLRNVSSNVNKLSSCPSCRKPLPRCSLCLLHMGTNVHFPPQSAFGHEGLGWQSKSFSKWFSWCQTCRHGGHTEHIMQWFSQNSECPVALCSCKCFDMDGTIPKSYRDVS
ncbi:GATOR complex protein MIOS isoform X1 [Episyrphus balteatus]|uniref:GATOR complex protein MIOS isoform X1 n=1 Tax=Episyrphus balteatus TaxID=286459 RepID=UPI002485D529|nr:GATOR complex protein MIOS isoform X1 [Episyrphus balteatus]